MREMVVVFRDTKKRQIDTYVNLGGHGARISVSDFLSKVADAYGNPASTMTIKSHADRLKAAAEVVITEMKASTREVAAINMQEEKHLKSSD